MEKTGKNKKNAHKRICRIKTRNDDTFTLPSTMP